MNRESLHLSVVGEQDEGFDSRVEGIEDCMGYQVIALQSFYLY